MKRLFLPLALSALVIAACGSGEEQVLDASDAAKTPAAEASPEPTTAGDIEASETAVPTPSGEAPAESLGDPASVRERDWVLGAASPVVTLIEYGDFQ